jgi:hypothetical protein
MLMTGVCRASLGQATGVNIYGHCRGQLQVSSSPAQVFVFLYFTIRFCYV